MRRLFHRMSPRTVTGLLLALIAATLAPLSNAQAWTFKSLYSFCARGTACHDGSNPNGPLLLGPDGTLYGVTQYGGHRQLSGVAFAISQGARGSWKHHSLYHFCRHASPNCQDGAAPDGGLIMDTAGNLYGVAQSGGAKNDGVVFELSPPPVGGWEWSETVLYSFDSSDFPTGRLAYAGQQTGALYDGASPLYGTTEYGGKNGSGDVYELTLSHGSWSKATLHDFCSLDGCADGDTPSGNLLIDSAGNLYGQTMSLGLHESGTAYEISESEFQVLHTFCSQGGCADPGGGYAGLIRDDSGNFYGTTLFGGPGCKPLGCGVIYKLSPDGTSETVLHDFCSLSKCADGHGSDAELLLDGSGNLFGTAVHGGDKDEGVVLLLSGKDYKVYQVLYSFCTEKGCADGGLPESALTVDAGGRLFGVTREGGAFGSLDAHTGGTVFMLTP